MAQFMQGRGLQRFATLPRPDQQIHTRLQAPAPRLPLHRQQPQQGPSVAGPHPASRGFGQGRPPPPDPHLGRTLLLH
jgi:hypothetical protein